MEIVIVWSWFSFIVGLLAGPALGLIWAVVAAYKQWKKRQKTSDSFDKLFQGWNSKDAN